MKKIIFIILFIIILFLIFTIRIINISEKYEPHFTRGLIIVNTNKGILISYRSLKEDSNNTFKIYKNNKLIKELDNTNYLDKDGNINDTYRLEIYNDNKLIEEVFPEVIFKNINKGSSGSYYDIKLDYIDDYTPGDVSIFDADGDGIYELILKWDPIDKKDNSQSGYTSNVYIDCYRLNGEKLWRIDLGKNIRAGEHYAQIMAYDYDNDSKGEVILKTADGSIDGKGNIIGDINIDNRDKTGLINTGNEYLTLFDGITGEALDTISYEPRRGNVEDWGDNYGNRANRFLATSAYLDDNNPSVIFIRGYYTRISAHAYDIKDKKFKKKWVFDTKYNKKAEGDGNHQVMPADVDNDGKDEIVLGSAVIDHDGSLLYTTDLGHGDVLHVGDFDNNNPGLEIFMCYEKEESGYGISLVDGKTGNFLFRDKGEFDTGRCLIGNFIDEDNTYMVGIHNNKVFNTRGEYINNWNDNTTLEINNLIYWRDGYIQDILDGTNIEIYGKGNIFKSNDIKSINGTKNNASLIADILGDYREEIIYPTKDNKYLRIYTTTYESNNKLITLMQNRQYRMQVVSQNVGYNQMAHLDYIP